MYGKIASAAFGFIARSREARAQATWDRYNNAMVDIQAAQAHNVLAENTAALRQSRVEDNILVQTQLLRATASAANSAASAGTGGGSVASVIHDLTRSAGMRDVRDEDRFDQGLLNIDQQRRQIEVQRRTGTKPITQQPSLLGQIGATGLSILADYEASPQSAGLEGGDQVTRLDHFRNQLML